jgi:hypothetical protein
MSIFRASAWGKKPAGAIPQSNENPAAESAQGCLLLP